VSQTMERTYGPGATLTRGAGSRLRVGELLGEGAEGVVYEVVGESPALVLKHFNQNRLTREPGLRSRLEAMVAARPAGWREHDSRHVLLTWPIDTAFDGEKLVGYVMPRIDAAGAVEIHVVSNASDRRDPSPRTPRWVRGFTWEYLLQTASNLALATAVLHSSGCVVGDFNDRNILVTSRALVTLVDCDSMQVPKPGGGAYLCQVGRPEFNAPELASIDLGTVPRASSSDLFPLAVHIHQLLLEGVHPFDGVWRGAGEKPKRAELAAQGIYVYAGDHVLSPHDLWMPFDLVPGSVQDLFRRAFVDGVHEPSCRPTGAEWRTTLVEVQASLCTCKRDSRHVYGGHLRSCPWCEQKERVRHTQQHTPRPSPAVRPPASATHAGSPHRRSLNRPAVWIVALVALVVAVLVIESLTGSGTTTPPGGHETPTRTSATSTPSARPEQPTAQTSTSRSGVPSSPTRTGTSTSASVPARHGIATSHSHPAAKTPSSGTAGLSGSATPTQSAPPSSSSGLSGSTGHEAPASTPSRSHESSGGGLSGSAEGESSGGLSGSASH